MECNKQQTFDIVSTGLERKVDMDFFSVSKKIEFAEISAHAHGWSYQDIHQFRHIHLTSSDSRSQKSYLTQLLNAIDATRQGTPIQDMLYYPDSQGMAS